MHTFWDVNRTSQHFIERQILCTNKHTQACPGNRIVLASVFRIILWTLSRLILWHIWNVNERMPWVLDVICQIQLHSATRLLAGLTQFAQATSIQVQLATQGRPSLVDPPSPPAANLDWNCSLYRETLASLATATHPPNHLSQSSQST